MSNNFFLKSYRLWVNGEKYCTAEQATEGNTLLHAEYLRLQTHTRNM